MADKVLFIGSDLATTDTNGKTLRDVFAYLELNDCYCFTSKRENQVIPPKNVYFANEKLLFRPFKIKKHIHDVPSSNKVVNFNNAKKIKKNPLTCILRNMAWSFAFLFFKSSYKKWLKQNNFDYIVFDPGDFLFMHKIAYFTSKFLNKKMFLYNTEDYYFKKHNYLHKERGFNFLYPLFRRKVIKSYKKTFSKTSICFHNTEGLCDQYAKEFDKVQHLVVYHSSQIIPNQNRDYATYKNFYYCGNLARGRDVIFLQVCQAIKKIMPESKIYVNSYYIRSYNEDNISKLGNIVHLGYTSNDEIQRRLNDNFILLNCNPFDSYNAMDKVHGFSTKLSDYISSLNPIFHVGPPGDETNTLEKYNLAYICKTTDDIDDSLLKLKSDLKDGCYSLDKNQINFYNTFLDANKVSKYVKKVISEELNK